MISIIISIIRVRQKYSSDWSGVRRGGSGTEASLDEQLMVCGSHSAGDHGLTTRWAEATKVPL